MFFGGGLSSIILTQLSFFKGQFVKDRVAAAQKPILVGLEKVTVTMIMSAQELALVVQTIVTEKCIPNSQTKMIAVNGRKPLIRMTGFPKSIIITLFFFTLFK